MALPTMSSRLSRIAAAAVLVACACDKDDQPGARPRPPTTKKVAAVPRPPRATPGQPAAQARCTMAEGDVQVGRAGTQAWTPLDTNDPIAVGDWVRTGQLSFASVVLADGTRLEFDESTVVEVRLGSITMHSGTVQGTFEATGLELAPLVGSEGTGPSLEVYGEDGSQFTIVSKDGEHATFRLTGDNAGTRVKVESGQATVQVSGEASPVAAGAQVELEKGHRVAAAKPLDAPAAVEPEADARVVYREGAEIPFSWRPVSGARGYRVQVATDLSFTHLVISKKLEGTQLRFSPPKDAMYVWRVVARDARGREGELGAVRRLHVLAGPEANDLVTGAKAKDLLVAPEPNATYEFTDSPPKVTFRWGADPGAKRYRWVLAEGPDLLNQTVKTELLTAQRLEFDELPKTGGEFYWGVFGEHENPVPLFSKPRRLVVKKVRKARFETVKKIDAWGK